MKRIILAITIIIATALTVFAEDAAGTMYKANADAAYQAKDYQKAIELYQKELQQGVSAATYHNLGNAYYRSGNIPMAVLMYEKAKKLAPVDPDIQHSLDIARKKTVDKLQPEAEIFIVQWYRFVRNLLSVDGWATLSIITMVLSLLLFLAYLFMQHVAVRKASFFGSVVMMGVFLLANLFAWTQKQSLLTHDTAIVMKAEVEVKSSPVEKAATACTIHEGTWLRITDAEMQGWYGIQLSDGREGWVKTDDIKEI